VKPTLFLGVPRVWEKIQAKLTAMGAENPVTGIKLKVKNMAFESALHHHEHSQLGGDGSYPKLLLSHSTLDSKGTEMFLLNEYFVLKCACRLNILY
jgi:long-subunit acyl-CoA synthetase (AMP-forming)